MKISVGRIKVIVMAVMFLLFAGGRVYHLRIVGEMPPDIAFLTGVYFGLFAAVISMFIVDLVLARGLLQSKIRSLKLLVTLFILGILLVGEVAANLSVHLLGLHLFRVIVGLLLILGILLMDSKQTANSLHVESNDLPEIYLRKQPFKSFFELMFRLFPNPEPTALYKIGNPQSSSPVFVTGNFELTVRRVVRALPPLDCWLLVCDSRGINIWCASESGKFGTANIIKAIHTTNLAEKVNHKQIILPQLSASNVSVAEIEKETGFVSRFGPVHARDIGAYLKNPDTREIRSVTFDLRERMEVSLGSPIILVIVLLTVFNFMGYPYLLTILPLIYLTNFIHAIVFPRRIIRNVLIWAVFFGALVFAVNYLMFSYLLALDFWLQNITISIGIAYLVLEFEGWSPLVKFSYGLQKKAQISVDEEECTGCKTCTYVCPKAVFEIRGNKSKVVDESACLFCGACFVQCPVGAIAHSMSESMDTDQR